MIITVLCCQYQPSISKQKNISKTNKLSHSKVKHESKSDQQRNAVPSSQVQVKSTGECTLSLQCAHANQTHEYAKDSWRTSTHVLLPHLHQVFIHHSIKIQILMKKSKYKKCLKPAVCRNLEKGQQQLLWLFFFFSLYSSPEKLSEWPKSLF